MFVEMINYNKPNLTEHPPRSPRVKLGGFVQLPRILDKARATLAGLEGEYKFGTLMDCHFFSYTGIEKNLFLKEVEKEKSDYEMLLWIRQNMNPRRHQCEIDHWSRWMNDLSPEDKKMREFLAQRITDYAPHRDDISTYFEHLDTDDFACFGGKP